MLTGKTLDDVVNNSPIEYSYPGGAGDYMQPSRLKVRANNSATIVGSTQLIDIDGTNKPSYFASPGTTGSVDIAFTSGNKSTIDSYVASNSSYTHIFFVATPQDHD